ncbi:probable G-protein coupled receptor No18 [Wyeomyia smithii]|uniref:probable G-protein coupled receptor No18 n=1 Tax=Wyeomyia smithii TaxID=174621 RepID=UPI002467B72D|nr:probable G-protein coupled receptor No18 [Wyeomyia smithii]XP_055523643.1 probable G-protein coupled receptor No18 [Wyeomyia smithii]XP_055523644.1 probable G-protein coupled receptor No18 [Wyeomyia smithii]XP_055523645.1 probable G-protein coupled receptor No18 [Wyeomyia smithii]XP_055523646.1 probable G-protein coupled receptor No18 [Wyeomyia smithii]XP_055523647.1 probable G-protein coupled receptor No18 [Wyeomyia smithii]XP_055523648.1 probable G-protein coupled receptor No18 [Wyeomyia
MEFITMSNPNGSISGTMSSITINYTASFANVYNEIYVNLQIVNGNQLNISERFVVNAAGNASFMIRTNAANNEDSIRTNTSKECGWLCLSWEKMLLVVLFCTLIIVTVIGNTLVILSVATTRRLRTVTNCFVMSLAVADWLVGIFVMPPAVMLFVVEKWQLGWILCDIWISLDVLLCTASILSLCAISVDRYLAVTQPLTYSKRRRSKRLALIMIFVVWLVALAITCPPILGWYDQGRKRNECMYNQNKGYVVFSAMGSFFIPMTVMLYVYSKICCVLTSRQHRMSRTEATEKSCDLDVDYNTSENDTSPKSGDYVGRTNSTAYTQSHQTLYEFLSSARATPNAPRQQQKATRLITSGPTPSNASGIAKYSNNYEMQPIHSVQFSASQLSLAESCVSNVTLNNTSKFRLTGKRIPIRISSLKRETKTAQTLSMVMGGFIACWLPFFIYYLLMPFLPESSKSADLMAFLTWLGWINSAINPFIYAFYNVDFRIAFWRLTIRKLHKNKHNLALFRP